MQIGELISPDGTVKTVRPHNSKEFTLEELQGFVGGYIELVSMKRGNGRGRMYVNEEGKLKGLAWNEEATKIAAVGDYGDIIVGPAIIVRKEKK